MGGRGPGSGSGDGWGTYEPATKRGAFSQYWVRVVREGVLASGVLSGIDKPNSMEDRKIKSTDGLRRRMIT